MIAADDTRRALSFLMAAERPALITHRKPDGDALGAALGLRLALDSLGKRAIPVCRDPVPEQYCFLPGVASFVTDVPRDTDAIVLLDCGSDHLAGFDVGGTPCLLEIDHHRKSAPVDSRLTVYDPAASSTAEIIYELLTAWRWRLDRPLATCLLTGIISDTSAFQNANVSARTLAVAGALLRAGANRKEIVRHCFFTSSVPKLRLWGTAMARIDQNVQSSNIVSTVLTKEDIEECGAHPNDIEGLVNFLNAIPGVPALLLLTDLHQGEVKGSFRTRADDIDVSRLAGLLGGGGHKQAAGFSIPGRLSRNADDSWEVQPPTLMEPLQ